MAVLLPPVASAPTADQLANPQTAKTWKAAQEFEAMALGQFLEPMFDTVDTAQGLFGGGAGETAWKPMLVQEMAKNLSHHGGLGLAMPVFRQMLQMQEARSGASPGHDTDQEPT